MELSDLNYRIKIGEVTRATISLFLFGGFFLSECEVDISGSKSALLKINRKADAATQNV
jgi:hypothetical protein